MMLAQQIRTLLIKQPNKCSLVQAMYSEDRRRVATRSPIGFGGGGGGGSGSSSADVVGNVGGGVSTPQLNRKSAETKSIDRYISRTLNAKSNTKRQSTVFMANQVFRYMCKSSYLADDFAMSSWCSTRIAIELKIALVVASWSTAPGSDGGDGDGNGDGEIHFQEYIPNGLTFADCTICMMENQGNHYQLVGQLKSHISTESLHYPIDVADIQWQYRYDEIAKYNNKWKPSTTSGGYTFGSDTSSVVVAVDLDENEDGSWNCRACMNKVTNDEAICSYKQCRAPRALTGRLLFLLSLIY